MYTQPRRLMMVTGIALVLSVMSNSYAAETVSKDVSRGVSNARLETQIWTTYALSPYLRANDIQVTVEDGKAILTGVVDEDVNKDLAKEIALGVNGIKDVDNRIEVQADYVPPKRSATDRSYGETIDDASITAAVKSRLSWSKHAGRAGTEVTTRSGKVTLGGTVDSDEAKAHADSLARNTRGVMSVDNNLKVDMAMSSAGGKADAKSANKSMDKAGQSISDTWITTKVMTTLMYSSNVDGSDISVNTKAGVVTLSGKVDSGAEQALAIELAKNIRGVDSVNSDALVVDNTVATY